MRVLVVHSFYGSANPSGENEVVDAEIRMLRARGHAVELFSRHSDDLLRMGVYGAILAGISTPWNPRAAATLARFARSFAPDIIHVHNTFPMLSPAIFHSVRGIAPRVITLHNYRVFCPGAIPSRNAKPCVECIERRNTWPSLKYGCYRNSRLATLPVAASVSLHRLLRTWERHVEAFIALNTFQASLLRKGGLPEDRVHVKPNFSPGVPSVVPWQERSGAAVFVGRLSVEKGVEYLVDAWRRWGPDAPELLIVGDGPLRERLEEMASGARVRLLGRLDRHAAHDLIKAARLLILPSVWFEGFPMVLQEAFAFGTPVAVSNIGSLSHIVRQGKCGVLFEPGNALSLLEEVRAAWHDPIKLECLAAASRREFEAHYTEEANYRRLIMIYRAAGGIVSSDAAKVE